MVETNSVDPDHTAPTEQSDLGLHCLTTLIFVVSDALRANILTTNGGIQNVRQYMMVEGTVALNANDEKDGSSLEYDISGSSQVKFCFRIGNDVVHLK